jgi:hypothetical protein
VLCYGAVGAVQQILYGRVKGHEFSGWKPVSPSPGDQRHVAAALDPEGRLHVVWREGLVRNRAAAGPVSIFYSTMESDGSWRKPARVSAAGENASTPSIAASGSGVFVAWVAWSPRATNSEGKTDNGFPFDNSAVEGRLETTWKRYGSSKFDAPMVVDGGPASYPTWALRAAGGDGPPPLIWTSSADSTAAAGGPVRLHFGWCETPSR